jgi:glycolate oxidase iron-sulfur subunit
MAVGAVPTPRFLADVYEAASECNKCSLCQATCPAYVVNPVEWETARGRIALIRDAIEGKLELSDIEDGPLSSCLTCDNCVAACAPRVPTGHIVSRARQELHAQEGYPWGQSFALRSVLPRPGALRALHGFARFTQRTGLYGLARRIGLLSWLGTVGALAEQSGPPPARTVYQMLGDLPEPAEPVRGTVALLVCCLSNLTVPESTEATIRVLLASGYAVDVPVVGCSGLPARTLGDRDAMIDMAVRNSAAMSTLDVDAYIGDSASCTEHYREYGSIAGEDRQVGARARDIAHHTALASDFLDRNGVRAVLGPLRWRVTIDEPCALPIDGPERGAVRRLLEQIPHLDIVPLHERAMCCGGAGTYFARQPERSEAILRRKFENIKASGAEIVVTENVSCLLQLRAGAARYAPDLKVMHVMEVMLASMQGAERRRAVLAG